SVVFISSALGMILTSKEAKRSGPLHDSAQTALEMIRTGQVGNKSRDIFEPLRLACETRSDKLMIASLDCISKLISCSFFAEEPSDRCPPSPPSPAFNRRRSMRAPQSNISRPSFIDLVIHTIASCHSETAPEAVSLQVVKALLSLVLSPTIYVHRSSLLKVVRTVYNVFLLSTDPVNQTAAQGALTQIVHHIFTRCRLTRLNNPEDASSHRPSANSRRLLTSFKNGIMTVLPLTESSGFLPSASAMELPESGHAQGALTVNDMSIQDAFLVFQALCKSTMEPVNNERCHDPKSHSMRSKLLSLHLVLTVLNSHMELIVNPAAIIYSISSHEATTFIQAINQYLCLCLSRNAVSPVPQVFAVSVELFWHILSGMRTELKKEIKVLLHEIFIPILEMQMSTLKQKAVVLAMLSKFFQRPQALVEMYLNYDCDGEVVDSIYGQ
ncbi:hypothetical protein SCLCIDRAFT_124676, partial [Scleroderma citrinum Foug A]